MTTLEWIAIITLSLLLLFWKHIAIRVLTLYDDYTLWRSLRNQSLTSLTFWEYWRDEC